MSTVTVVDAAMMRAYSIIEESLKVRQNVSDKEREKILKGLRGVFSEETKTTLDICNEITKIITDAVVGMKTDYPTSLDYNRIVMCCLVLLSLRNTKMPQFGENSLVSISL